jgi:1-acyl-sn-glycerol-3-phosphate acyltransferase
VIRGVWSWFNGALATLVIGPPVILAALLRVRRRGFYDWAGRAWSRWNLWAGGATVQVRGTEHLDPASPQILVGNHQSWFDVFAVAASLPKTYHFVAKKELEDVFIFGRAWQAAGHISIDRANQAAAVRALDEAGQQMRAENSAVVVFAEGTRTPTDHMLPFKKGAFMLALHTGVDLVPVAVVGTRDIMPAGSWRVRSGRIIVRFGRPIRTGEFGEARRDELIALVRERITELLHPERAHRAP